MNDALFFARIRETLFRGGMTQPQVDGINAILDEAETRETQLDSLAYALATTKWETGSTMQPIEENLYYTSAKRIRQVWPSRFPSEASAAPFTKNPRALANKVYGNRADLGNGGGDDGWNFRGRGLPMITGRGNYRKLGKAVGIDIETHPERMLEMPVALDVLFVGMNEGLFTGYSQADAAAVPGFDDDRKIINGTDQAAVIAGTAVAFKSALQAAGYSGVSKPTLPPVDGFTPEEVETLVAMSNWLNQRPQNAGAVLHWLSQMPKELQA